MDTFLLNIKNNTHNTSIEELEDIATEYPYFQLAKSLLLKKYHQQQHFKYNNALKNVAAHTQSRELLFEYINHLEEEKEITVTTKIKEIPVIPNRHETAYLTENLVEPKEELTPEKPFKFNNGEKHSFHQWLQLKETKPIDRTPEKTVKKPIHNKLNIINQFIQNNPKISPIKKSSATTNPTNKNASPNIANELMTETLAKVYIAQKKYDNAIQAYRILSLKYPEKSSLFADQIQRIKILQTHKSS